MQGVQGSGFRGSGFRVWGLGSRVWRLRLRVVPSSLPWNLSPKMLNSKAFLASRGPDGNF